MYYQNPSVETLTIQPQTKILFASGDTPEPGLNGAPKKETKTV